MDRVAGPGEDGLSSLLRDVRVRSVVYCLSDFAAPWGFSVERSPVAKFHVLLHGTAALTVSGATPVRLVAGDLVVNDVLDIPAERAMTSTLQRASGRPRSILTSCAMPGSATAGGARLPAAAR